jgi:TonB-dependent receptor
MKSIASLVLLVSVPVVAMSQGIVRGQVMTTDGRAAIGAAVRLTGTRLGAIVDSTGRYRIDRIPAGIYGVRVTRLAFSPDSATVTIVNGRTTELDLTLRPSAALLGASVVTAQRLGESEASALSRRQDATNIVGVMAGDVIRALPNVNVAEAAGRMAGVTTERDEGEGKFVQVRGTEPRLSSVTINGAHVPGSEFGSRIPKLDDIPSDIVGAIEVSKTLTADMDADAIGGTVNLVTKTPEGAPAGYLSAQYGAISLLNRNQYQGGFAYGGRFGEGQRLGLLLGGSADRTNRTINDLEPAWAVDPSGRAVPIEWAQRDYTYRRNRYGLGGDVDYRFQDGSTIALKGLYSRFENRGTTYSNDLTIGQTGSTVGSFGDSAVTGTRGFGTGAEVTRMAYERTPIEQLYGGMLAGHTTLGRVAATLTANLSGTTSDLTDYRFHPFVYDGPGGQGLTVAYDASDTKVPTFRYATAAMTDAANTPTNFVESHYFTIDRHTTGRDAGGALDFSAPWHDDGGAWRSLLRFGGKVRDERKDFARTGGFWFTPSGSFDLSTVPSGFSDPTYYHFASNAFSIGPMPDQAAAHRTEDARASAFVNGTDTVANILGSLSGSERIYAAYASNTIDAGPLEVYLGLRAERTRSTYIGHAASFDTTGTLRTLLSVPGTQSYTDLFPSLQLRYALSPSTDVRGAVTRGIARPDYAALAPSLQGTLDAQKSNPGNLTTGNPDLLPQHAWNYDLLVEHFFPSVGVLSGGVFYKRITDFIFNQTFTYNGPITAFDGQLGTRPENGGSGHIWGIEGEWAQRLVFLPGAYAGLGFDLNWTHTESQGLVNPTTGRFAPLQRQSPNLGNAALTYDFRALSGRLGVEYQGASITSYGDGSPTPTGDTYYYAHTQVDASVSFNVDRHLQVQLQGLNLNNAPFGFFTGTPGSDYAIQREYYGRTAYLGLKYAL